MGHGHDERDDHWGESTARVTFLWTIIGAVLFAGAVFAFIL
jgi:hypothetical protein